MNDTDPFSRKSQINRLRASQHGKNGFDTFDSFFDRVDNNLNFKPKRTFVKFGLIAIFLNLLLWGALIAMVVFGLSFII